MGTTERNVISAAAREAPAEENSEALFAQGFVD